MVGYSYSSCDQETVELSGSACMDSSGLWCARTQVAGETAESQLAELLKIFLAQLAIVGKIQLCTQSVHKCVVRAKQLFYGVMATYVYMHACMDVYS